MHHEDGGQARLTTVNLGLCLTFIPRSTACCNHVNRLDTSSCRVLIAHVDTANYWQLLRYEML
jgi:hypothetical protein